MSVRIDSRKLFIAVLFLALLSCRKKISGDSPFVGEWSFSQGGVCNEHIIVDRESNSTRFVNGNSKECYKANPKKGKFKLGKDEFVASGHKYKIVRYPAAIDTVVDMGGALPTRMDAFMEIRPVSLTSRNGPTRLAFRAKK